MASQALYRKWRSQTFDQVIGQQHVTQTLVNALKLGRVAHAYLFTGPRGTGKTSTARLLAKAVNCLAEAVEDRPCPECAICVAVNEARLLDLIEIDAASNTGVDDIRDLREKVGFRPGEARIKVYIIDEVHMLSKSAFNALLKTLEEPPEHVIFVLATTEPEKIPATITSRCQRFDFRRIKLSDIVGRLVYIVEQEGLEAEPEALEYIARQGSGSMRDAISLLDQLTAYSSETISLELVRTVLGAVTPQSVTELVEALIDRDVAAGLDIINRLVADGIDPRQFAHEIVDYLRALMLVKLGDGSVLLNLPDETLATIESQAARTDSSFIVQATTRYNEGLINIKSGLLDIPQLSLELAFIEATRPVVAGQPSPAEAPASPPTPVPTAPAAKVDLSPKKPTTSSSPPPKPSEESGAELSVETVQACFNQVLKDVEKKNRIMAEALRNQTRLYRVSGREIHFVTVPLMKSRFEKPKPQAALNEAFSQAIGQSVQVRFLSEEVVSDLSSKNRGQQTEDSNLNALVKTAEDLGGEVVE